MLKVNAIINTNINCAVKVNPNGNKLKIFDNKINIKLKYNIGKN